MCPEPSDIHSGKKHKLTRRRVLDALTAAGVAPVAASRITVDDVKAADDDQIPISLDVKGELKYNVPADWYDRLVHARDVRDKVNRNHGHRGSIYGIGINPGRKGGENPQIIIHFDEDSEEKEKDKNDTPDERDGVKIKKEEVPPVKPANCPDTDRYDNICNNYDCRTLPEGDNIPAGPLVDVTWPGGGWGAHTSRMMDNNATYHSSWMFAAHQVPDCEVQRQDVYHQPALDNNDWYTMGEIAEIYPEYDMAIIEATRGVDDDVLPSPYVHEASDLQNGAVYGPIEHTMSKDGVALWRNESRSVFQYSPRSCLLSGEVDEIFQDYSVDPDAFCSGIIKEAIWFTMSARSGDSGGLTWGYWSEQDAYLGISVTSSYIDGGFAQDRTTGSAGYRIYEDLGYYWK